MEIPRYSWMIIESVGLITVVFRQHAINLLNYIKLYLREVFKKIGGECVNKFVNPMNGFFFSSLSDIG